MIVRVLNFLVFLVSVSGLLCSVSVAQKAQQVEFFESKIRPVLVEHCYECHNSIDDAEANLAVDFRNGLKTGGDSGPAIVIGKPEKSLLLKVIRHEVKGVEMPDGGPKLSKDVIKDFEKWILDGAVDPRDKPPTEAELKQATSWEEKLKKRKQWWSFQPITKQRLPAVKNSDWSDHPIDRFILSKLDEQGLQPAGVADRYLLARRLSFVLTGLPPTPGDIEAFVNDRSPKAFHKMVSRYLDSPRYGEHWARHWMDVIRYADSHGSEGDPAVPNAYRYRDYLIRAFNNDVSFDRLAKEHVAGDLLPEPRINGELGINESAIGTAHWRMVFHGFAPTDALDEKVRFTDDQINVFSKAFLGLTVSCARCHDHKFDAISQKDFYALFGILASTRPAIIDANTKERQELHKVELTALKKKMKTRIADLWLKEAKSLTAEKILNDKRWQAAIKAAEKPTDALHLLHEMQKLKDSPEKLQAEWKRLSTDTKTKLARWEADSVGLGFTTENLLISSDEHFKNWHTVGNGSHHQFASDGEFTLETAGAKIIADVHPHGVYSNLLSTKHGGLLMSPNIHLKEDSDLWVLVAGDGQAMVRYAVHNYPRSGTVYPVTTLNGGTWRWQKYNLDYWTGEDIHIEITTAADSPVLAKNVPRSWFGISMAFIAPKGLFNPPNPNLEFNWELLNTTETRAVNNLQDVVELYCKIIIGAAKNWKEAKPHALTAPLIQPLLQANLLPNSTGIDAELDKLVAQYRKLEAEIPEPYRVPGLAEGPIIDQPLFVRGDHRKPADPVQRRFLEAIDTTPYSKQTSGRLQLANDLFRPDNPLTARVMVNRVWHYLFGEGLVRTPDNFGRLGETPSHPKLLDYLANQYVNSGWSTKELIRFMLTSKTWQLASTPSADALQNDPTNRYLSHAHFRRLPAESIRDALLATSGQLDLTMYGPGAGANNRSQRRSVYLTSRRNSMDRFLTTFNAPVPFATVGRRNSTNVPAQSLTLLNDSFVVDISRQWANGILKQSKLANDEARIEHILTESLGVQPTERKLKLGMKYLNVLRGTYKKLADERLRIDGDLEQIHNEVASIVEPVRKRILSQRTGNQTADKPAVKPYAHWTFDSDLKDSMGNLHGASVGNVQFENGALVLAGNSFVRTQPLPVAVNEKTLQVQLTLAILNQKGGGAITIQDLQGNVFDSVVFAERKPNRWMAGSDHFKRTQDFGGFDEKEALNQPVQITIVYQKDGRIICYRNGQPYGKPYKSNGLVTFAKGQSQIVFGLRHGTTPVGGRTLRGKIHEARFYNKALSPKEVAATFNGDPNFVSRRDLLAAMTDKQRQQLENLQSTADELQKQQSDLPAGVNEGQIWTDFVHAVFNLKEFIYLQ